MKLEKVTHDIVQAHKNDKMCFQHLQGRRMGIDQAFFHIYAHSVTMAEKVGATVGMPQIASRQQY